MDSQPLQYRLEAFEGPLDLLLTLISKNKIDIYDIPIAELIEQYLERMAFAALPRWAQDELTALRAAATLPTPASDGQVEAVRDVLAERKRQVDVEHWMPGHDDQHTGGELAQAAAAYAYYGTEAENSQPPAESIFPTTWDMSWWKPGDHRRNLVKAGALIIAEIERLDRLAAMGSTKR